MSAWLGLRPPPECSEAERGKLQRSMGLKMEQLKVGGAGGQGVRPAPSWRCLQAQPAACSVPAAAVREVLIELGLLPLLCRPSWQSWIRCTIERGLASGWRNCPLLVDVNVQLGYCLPCCGAPALPCSQVSVLV